MAKYKIKLPLKAIVKAYQAGESGRSIAKRYGVSHEVIYKRLVDQGVLLRLSWDLQNETAMIDAESAYVRTRMPIKHIAQEFGVNTKTLFHRLVRSGDHTPVRQDTPWTESEMSFVANHYKVDMTAEQIASRLDRTRNEIIGKARRMGLCSPLNSVAAEECMKLKDRMRA